MATASRTSAEYNAKYTSVLEYWYNERKAQDVVFRPTVLGWILNQLKRSRPLPPDVTIRLMMDQANGVDSFEFYDTVSTETSPGTKAARIGLAHYSAPIPMSLQEELDLTSDEAIADALSLKVRQMEMTMANRFAKDFYRGTAPNAKNVIGLEQILSAATQSGGAGAVDVDRWKYRQQTGSTYGNILRSAWTGDETGGTGWEACTANANNVSFALSSGIPNASAKLVQTLYDATNYGMEHVNLLVSSQQVWNEWMWAMQGTQNVQRAPSSFEDHEFMIDNVKYRGATWVPDEMAKSYDTTGAVASGQLGNLYGINTDNLVLLTDSRADMTLTPSRGTQDQHAAVQHVVWRGQLLCDNPRMLFRLFNLPGT